MGHIKDIQDFLQSKNIRGITKTLAFIVLFIFIVIWLDATGFFRYNCENKRLVHIEAISFILQDSTLTTQERYVLISQRHSAIMRQNWATRIFRHIDMVFEQTDNGASRNFKVSRESSIHCTCMPDSTINSEPIHSSLIDSMITPSISPRNFTQIVKPYMDSLMAIYADAPAVINNTKGSTRNNIWYFIATSWVLILVLILTPVVFFSEENRNNKRSDKIAGCIVLGALSVGLMFLLNWLWGLILNKPVWGYWWITYVVIAIAPIVLTVAFVSIAGSSKKK